MNLVFDLHLQMNVLECPECGACYHKSCYRYHLMTRLHIILIPHTTKFSLFDCVQHQVWLRQVPQEAASTAAWAGRLLTLSLSWRLLMIVQSIGKVKPELKLLLQSTSSTAAWARCLLTLSQFSLSWCILMIEPATQCKVLESSSLSWSWFCSAPMLRLLSVLLLKRAVWKHPN